MYVKAIYFAVERF